MTPLKIAILGYGRSGATLHADAIEALPDARLTAACDIDPERCRLAAQRFDCRTYSDYREMLRTEELDLISVVTRSDQHCSMACDCMRAGRNVLVTKPWCVNQDEARQMLAAADSSGVQLLPWLPARRDPVYLRLRELLADKVIGRIFCIRHAVSGFAGRDDWQTLKRYGGGYILNWGPHIVDLPILMADADVADVYAWTAQTITSGDTEDVFFADVRMANGIRVQAERTVAVDFPYEWFIQGDRGTIWTKGNGITVCSGAPHQPADPTDHGAMQASSPDVRRESISGIRWGDAADIYADIAKALRGEQTYDVAPEQALELTRQLDAIRTAATLHQAVAL